MRYRSYHSSHIRKRSRRALLASIAIHIIALLLVNLKFLPILQRLDPDSPLKSEVEVRFVEPILPFSSEETRSRLDLPSMIGSRHPMSSRFAPSVSSSDATKSGSYQYKVSQSTVSSDQISETGPSSIVRASNAMPLQLTPSNSKSDSNLTPLPDMAQTELNGTYEPYTTKSMRQEAIKPRSDISAGSNGSTESAEEGQEGLSRVGQIGSAMGKFANYIASDSKNKKCDVIFLLDTSGSMQDNIQAVEQNLDSMVDVFAKEEVDYLFAVVKFKYNSLIYPSTKDVEKVKRLLRYKMRVGGDEMAYDAISKAASRIEFRSDTDKYFIIVTDEPFKGNYSYLDVLKSCIESHIHVYVLGVDDPFQRWLTERTGGIWMGIPE